MEFIHTAQNSSGYEQYARVFLSHSSTDFTIVDAYRERLESNGIPCWIAPRDIPLGSNYAAELPEAIKHCLCMLVFVSERSLCSIEVEKEIGIAVRCGKKMIPVYLENCALRGAFETHLGNNQWFIAYDATEEQNDILIQFLKELQNAEPQPEPAEASPVSKTQPPPPLDESMVRHALEWAKDDADAYAAALRALDGDAEGQYQLGLKYYERTTCRKQTCYWLELAAAQDHPRAMYLLGKCCFYGYGTELSQAKAIMYYEKCLEHDDPPPDAMWSLGDCYRKGKGVPRNIARAAAYYRQAMDHGSYIGSMRYIELVELPEKLTNDAGKCRAGKKEGFLRKIDRIILSMITRVYPFDKEVLAKSGHTREGISESMYEWYLNEKKFRPLPRGAGLLQIGLCILIGMITLAIVGEILSILGDTGSYDVVFFVLMGAALSMILWGTNAMDTDEAFSSVKRAKEYTGVWLGVMAMILLTMRFEPEIAAVCDRVAELIDTLWRKFCAAL